MRDTRPFVGNFFIVNYRVAVIFPVEIVIRRAQVFVGERLAVFRFFMHDLLEFGKLRLAEQRGADHVHIIIQKIFLRLFIRGLAEQIF